MCYEDIRYKSIGKAAILVFGDQESRSKENTLELRPKGTIRMEWVGRKEEV